MRAVAVREQRGIVAEPGALIGFAKITRDMTEQRAAQLAALESERHFRLLVEGVTDYAVGNRVVSTFFPTWIILPKRRR